jgi:hypothetical protein
MGASEPNRRHSHGFTVRLTPEEYEDMLAKCESCEPPTTPTAAIRWLLKMWIEEGQVKIPGER